MTLSAAPVRPPRSPRPRRRSKPALFRTNSADSGLAAVIVSGGVGPADNFAHSGSNCRSIAIPCTWSQAGPTGSCTSGRLARPSVPHLPPIGRDQGRLANNRTRSRSPGQCRSAPDAAAKRRVLFQGAVRRQVTRQGVPPRYERGRFSHGGRPSPLSRGLSSATGKTTTIMGRTRWDIRGKTCSRPQEDTLNRKLGRPATIRDGPVLPIGLATVARRYF